MSHRHNHMYMIVCRRNGLLSYYGQGLHIENIPLGATDVLALFKITQHNRKVFKKNLYPALVQFLYACHRWFSARRSPRYLLRREMGFPQGQRGVLPFVNYYRQTYKPPSYFSERIQGL